MKLLNKQVILRMGKLKTNMPPAVCDIGYIGNTKVKNKKVYRTWHDMIRRCYDDKAEIYKYCGAKGVTVSDRWKCFANFQEDFKELEGWDKERFENKEIVLDKDKKQINKPIKQRVYSKNTCCWLSQSENVIYALKNYNKFKAISPNNKEYIAYSQKKFADTFNLDNDAISKILNNPQRHKTHKGWSFEYIE